MYLYVSVCHICAVPVEARRDVRSPEAEVTGHVCCLEPLEEQEEHFELLIQLSSPCPSHCFEGYQPLDLGFTLI